MKGSMFKTALVLGLLSTVGPFAIDMFLPALPDVANDLGQSVAATQATLTSFFIAFGITQMIYGPWADKAGRKPPLYIGLLIFIIGSLGCYAAPSVEWLVAFRFLQGAGGAVVMVVPRAIIRDLHTGNEATRLMASIMLVISVSPMLAPLFGSLVITAAGWRLIFAILCGAAVVSILLTRFVLEETLAPEHRVPVAPMSLIRNARGLLLDRTFMSLTFVGGFGMASFFVFIASASFVYTGQYGLSPTQFSIAFALNAAGFFACSQLAAPLGMKFGMIRVVNAATIGFALISFALLGVALAGDLSLYVLIGMLFCATACQGLVIPTTMVMALDDHGDVAGLASSLGGTLQMVAGGIMISLAAPFFDGTATPMVAAIAVCGASAFVMSQIAIRRKTVRAAD